MRHDDDASATESFITIYMNMIVTLHVDMARFRAARRLLATKFVANRVGIVGRS